MLETKPSINLNHNHIYNHKEQGLLLSRNDVERFLPHREPFLFIDSVKSISHPEKGLLSLEGVLPRAFMVGVVVEANFFVRADLPLFKGHFPGNPVFPGVIQIETMAQASCFTVMKLFENPFTTKFKVALLKVEKTKFRKPVLPGMELSIFSVCKKLRGNITSYECRIENQGEIMSETEILASIEL